MREVKEGQIYRHFKGNVIKVLYLAKSVDDLRELVVYEHNGDIWVRDKEEFLSKTDKVKYPNVTQEYRFELVKEATDKQ